MLILLSFSPVWDYGRCLYTFFFWFALYVEGVNDDRYFFEKYEAYREYIRRVRTRFFYLDFLFGNKKKNILEENKKEEEENKSNENDKEYRRRRKNNKKKQE